MSSRSAIPVLLVVLAFALSAAGCTTLLGAAPKPTRAPKTTASSASRTPAPDAVVAARGTTSPSHKSSSSSRRAKRTATPGAHADTTPAVQATQALDATPAAVSTLAGQGSG